MRQAIEAATDSGTREEKIHALNLDYAARSLSAGGGGADPHPPAAERAMLPAVDFVRAKVHLALNDTLEERLLEPRLQLVTYGRTPGGAR